MKKKLIAAMLSAVMAISMLSGCSTPAQSDSDSEGESEKVFRYAISTEPTTLDPTKGNSTTDNEIQHALTEGLVRNSSGEIEPGVAESWEVSDDGLTYTFHLRDDALWSDGETITADDFVYAWRRLMDPETACPYAFIGEYVLNGAAVERGEMALEELGIEAKDDQTVVVTLENPTSYFLSLIGSCAQFAPVREDAVEEYGSDFAATAEQNVYSGPFKLVSSEDNKWIFEPNENYWNAESINWDRAEINFVANSDTAIALYEDGELDYVKLSSSYVEEYEDTADTYQSGGTVYCYLNLNSDNPVMSNQNFRKALNYSLDREKYVTLATSGVNDAYGGIVFSGISGGEGKTYSEAYDRDYYYPTEGDADLAKECLTAAMEELGYSDASEITVELMASDTEIDKKRAEVLQEMWQNELGINVKIKQTTWANLYSTAYPNGEFEIGIGSWGPDYDDPYTYIELYRSDSSYNYSGYSNEEFDALLDASRSETDERARMDLLNEAEQMLIEDAVCIPLEQANDWYIMDSDVEGVNFYFCGYNLNWIYGDVAE